MKDETIAAINAGEVPTAFQEDLTARVNELVNNVNCPPPPEEEVEEDEDEGRGKKKGKDKKDDEPVITLPTVPESDE